MSVFFHCIKSFSQQYDLAFLDRLKLVLHYPLFKLFWLSLNGKPFIRFIAKNIFSCFRHYRIQVVLCGKDGNRIVVPICFYGPDLQSFREIFWGHEYRKVLDLPKINTIFDIGANTGMATRYFLANISPRKIVMVEANPVLAMNLKKREIDRRVIVEMFAIYGREGKDLHFKVLDNHRDSRIVDCSEKGDDVVAVKSLRLLDLLSRHNLMEVDLLKMDIEGAEHNIMEYNSEAFLRFKYIIIEIHGNQSIRKEFVTKLVALGFEFVSSAGVVTLDCENALFRRIETVD